MAQNRRIHERCLAKNRLKIKRSETLIFLLSKMFLYPSISLSISLRAVVITVMSTIALVRRGASSTKETALCKGIMT